jgi:hypothetical protein
MNKFKQEIASNILYDQCGSCYDRATTRAVSKSTNKIRVGIQQKWNEW